MDIWSLNLSSLCSTDSTWVTQGIFVPQKTPPHVPRAILRWGGGRGISGNFPLFDITLISFQKGLCTYKYTFKIIMWMKRIPSDSAVWGWNRSRELTQLLVIWEYADIHFQRCCRPGFRLSLTRFNTCIFDSNTRNTRDWYTGGNRMSSHWDLLFAMLFSAVGVTKTRICVQGTQLITSEVSRGQHAATSSHGGVRCSY